MVLSANGANKILGGLVACRWISGACLLDGIYQVARKCGERSGKISYFSATSQHFYQHDAHAIEITSIINRRSVSHLFW